jgi:general secretion pathway protein K
MMARLSTTACDRAPLAEAGFVLVAVLWMLAALASLALVYSAYTANTAVASHVFDDRLQAEASIRAGLELAVYRQLTVPQRERPAEGRFSARVGRTTVAVRFRSEAARIDLNAAPPELLAGLFVAVGVPSDRAKTFADRVVAWRTRGEANAVSKEAKLYVDKHVPYPPRQAPFDNVLELSLLPDIPRPIVEKVLPIATVFSGRGDVDVRVADPLALMALPGMTPETLDKVLKGRANRSTDDQKLLAMLGPAKENAAIAPPRAIRAEIDVAFDHGRRVRAEVVFRPRDAGDEPYDLLYWRDDFDDPMQA